MGLRPETIGGRGEVLENFGTNRRSLTTLLNAVVRLRLIFFSFLPFYVSFFGGKF